MGAWTQSVALGSLLLAIPVSAARAQDAQPTAAELAARAAASYDQGDFASAAELYRAALALYEDATLHYNLARALQELAEWAEAREHYEAYLARAPDAYDRARIEARIQLLSERIAEASVTENGRPTDAAPISSPGERVTPPDEPSPTPAPWIVGGAGLLAVVVGAVFGWQFSEEVSRARAAPNHLTAFDHATAAERNAIVADILFLVGGAAAAVGLAWGIVDVATLGPDGSATGVRPHLRF